MTNMKSFNVLYDRDSDVLYVSSRSVVAARGIEEPAGVVWRYDKEGTLIGVTIINFYDYWYSRRPQLAREMSIKFEIPAKQAERVLDHALYE
ncbi:MAG: DUF2283 domain-containing protein [Roseiarcus sp.]